MASAEVTIEHASGLHARPAALFVKTASRFQSAITVGMGAKVVNAKSIVQVLTLGAKQGVTITITATGSDEAEAVATLTQLVASGFEGV